MEITHSEIKDYETKKIRWKNRLDFFMKKVFSMKLTHLYLSVGL